ncbi:glycosyltransferase family 2 protein [Raoultella sp. HC6]|uniref:glycosyltransferase family 2 protein n=1 Tax=Raoultella sp. HC6 TaxID=2923366 RepID=UPI001F514877|nr:glycosyltransferase family 2 protein [Raoultella sp. HC6]
MPSTSKIYALMTVKNESDIIIETLDKASVWAEKIFILDNNSEDTTWELLTKYAEENPKIVLWGQYGGRFYLELRQVIFREYREIAKPGDWWCRLDGDEFYIDDPHQFLSSLDEDVDHVYNASFQYYYTPDDYEREKNCGVTNSVTQRLKWYKCNHSEIRFVRHWDLICWPQNTEWPCNLKKPSPGRIRLKHYQYRDIKQIVGRLQARNAPNSGSSFSHEKVSISDWYKKRGFQLPEDTNLAELRIVEKENLSDSNEFAYDDKVLPPIYFLSFKKKIKNGVVNFYMKCLNKFLFKL